MKQPLYTLFLIAGLSLSLQAQQSFSITPNPVYGMNNDDFIIEGQATIKNLSTDTENFRWTRTIIRLDHDSLCFTGVTDPYLHWFHAVSEKTFAMEPQQEGPLYITLWDFEETGCCAIVNIKIKKLTGTPDSVNVLYYLRTCQPLAVSGPELASIEIFPNPVAESFSIKNAEMLGKLKICDASGKWLQTLESNPENKYELHNLPSGAYFLILENKSGAIIKVLPLTKI